MQASARAADGVCSASAHVRRLCSLVSSRPPDTAPPHHPPPALLPGGVPRWSCNPPLAAATLRHSSRQTSRARTGPSQAALRERDIRTPSIGCGGTTQQHQAPRPLKPRPFRSPRAGRHSAPDGVLSNARRRHVQPPLPPACPLSELARRTRPQQETLSASP